MQLWGLFEIDILDLFSQYMEKGCKNPRLLQYGDRSRLCLCHNESALGPFLGCFYLFLDHVCVSEHPWRNWLITLGEWWIWKRSQRLQITSKSTVQSSLCWAKLQPVNLVTRLKTAAYRTAPLYFLTAGNINYCLEAFKLKVFRKKNKAFITLHNLSRGAYRQCDFVVAASLPSFFFCWMMQILQLLSLLSS